MSGKEIYELPEAKAGFNFREKEPGDRARGVCARAHGPEPLMGGGGHPRPLRKLHPVSTFFVQLPDYTCFHPIFLTAPTEVFLSECQPSNSKRKD